MFLYWSEKNCSHFTSTKFGFVILLLKIDGISVYHAQQFLAAHLHEHILPFFFLNLLIFNSNSLLFLKAKDINEARYREEREHFFIKTGRAGKCSQGFGYTHSSTDLQ